MAYNRESGFNWNKLKTSVAGALMGSIALTLTGCATAMQVAEAPKTTQVPPADTEPTPTQTPDTTVGETKETEAPKKNTITKELPSGGSFEIPNSEAFDSMTPEEQSEALIIPEEALKSNGNFATYMCSRLEMLNNAGTSKKAYQKFYNDNPSANYKDYLEHLKAIQEPLMLQVFPNAKIDSFEKSITETSVRSAAVNTLFYMVNNRLESDPTILDMVATNAIPEYRETINCTAVNPNDPIKNSAVDFLFTSRDILEGDVLDAFNRSGYNINNLKSYGEEGRDLTNTPITYSGIYIDPESGVHPSAAQARQHTANA